VVQRLPGRFHIVLMRLLVVVSGVMGLMSIAAEPVSNIQSQHSILVLESCYGQQA